MSSGSIVIVTDRALPLGVSIEVEIAWPVKLDERIPLNMHVRGKAARSNGNRTDVAIERYEFRTRRSIQESVNRVLLLAGVSK